MADAPASVTRRGVLGLTAASLGLTLGPGGLAAPGPNLPDLTPMTDLVAGWVRDGIFPGAGLIVGQGDQILLERYFGGYARDSVVHVASAGKWVAAATIAALADEGAIAFDDPVAKWLPEFDGAKGQATLRQLLSHVAGYPDYQPDDRPRDWYQSLDQAVAAILPLPSVSPPGTRFRYGGLAMQVAGRMAELAAGQQWDAIFRMRIATPLGMTASGFTPVPEEPGFSPMLGGGFRTTLRDYAAFLRMVAARGVFRDRRVLSEAAVMEIERDQVGAATVMPGEYVDLARARRHYAIYGLGCWREELDANGRAVLISSPGWASAYPWVDRRTGHWGFLLAKADVPLAKAIGHSTFLSSPVLAPMLRESLDRAAAAQRGVRQGRAAVTGGQLYWEEAGRGEPMILLHGHSFDRTMWDPQMVALTAAFRVIRYDLRGYGLSSMPREGTAWLHADDLAELMDRLRIARAHLVGLSLGGTVAMDMVARHPGRVITATAASGDIFDFYPGPDEPWTQTAIAARRCEIAALRETGIHAFKRRWLDQLSTRGGGCLDSIRPKLWEMIARWTAWQPLHIEPRLLLGRALPDRLRRNPPAMPVQILTGDADLNRPNALLALFPNIPRIVIPNAGHVASLESPRAFELAVIRFARDGRTATPAELASAASACQPGPA